MSPTEARIAHCELVQTSVHLPFLASSTSRTNEQVRSKNRQLSKHWAKATLPVNGCHSSNKRQPGPLEEVHKLAERSMQKAFSDRVLKRKARLRSKFVRDADTTVEDRTRFVRILLVRQTVAGPRLQQLELRRH